MVPVTFPARKDLKVEAGPVLAGIVLRSPPSLVPRTGPSDLSANPGIALGGCLVQKSQEVGSDESSSWSQTQLGYSGLFQFQLLPGPY
jgi:hypothetical protein